MGAAKKPSCLLWILQLFQCGRGSSGGYYDYTSADDEAANRGRRRVRNSDEDDWGWVAERDINSKATDFISNFHQARQQP